jgi:hypothetical protein
VSNFTDLEDAIMDTWNVVTDIRNFIKKHPGDPKLEILSSFANMYDYKIERTYDLYEDCLRDYYETKLIKSSYVIPDDTIESIAEHFADYGGDISREKWVDFARAVLNNKQEDFPW